MTAVAVLARCAWTVPVVGVSMLWSTVRVSRALPDMPHRNRTAVLLAVRAHASAARQVSALLVRHWWPVVAVAVPFSGTLRRLCVGAVVVDSLVALIVEPPLRRPDLIPPSIFATLAGRRLRDLAYGAGVWAGVLRTRSIHAVLPDVVR